MKTPTTSIETREDYYTKRMGKNIESIKANVQLFSWVFVILPIIGGIIGGRLLFVFINLIVDIAYAVIDPRIRYHKKEINV